MAASENSGRFNHPIRAKLRADTSGKLGAVHFHLDTGAWIWRELARRAGKERVHRIMTSLALQIPRDNQDEIRVASSGHVSKRRSRCFITMRPTDTGSACFRGGQSDSIRSADRV
jgi:hypothetical protein